MILKDLIGKNLGVYQQVQVLVQGSMEAISKVERVKGRVDIVRITLTGGLEHRSSSMLEGTPVSIAEKPKSVAAVTKPKPATKRKKGAKKSGATVVKRSGRKKSAPTVSKP